jgi:hypothetical protein
MTVFYVTIRVSLTSCLPVGRVCVCFILLQVCIVQGIVFLRTTENELLVVLKLCGNYVGFRE